MSEFEKLVLRREEERARQCCAYAGLLMRQIQRLPKRASPSHVLLDRIEAALAQARQSEEVVAVLRDKVAMPCGLGWPR